MQNSLGTNSFGEQIHSPKDRQTAISNLQNIRMLQTCVNNNIYNKYYLIHKIVAPQDCIILHANLDSLASWKDSWQMKLTQMPFCTGDTSLPHNKFHSL